ncbi:MAG: L-aspartate oxidase [Bifidobacterium pseudocatenulatum]
MIVVVGAGIAGLCAALAAAGDSRLGSEGLSAGGRASIPKNGTYRPQEVLLVCKDKFVESNTYHAQGGVATAIFNDDSPALHATDTMAAGHGLCDRTAVDILTDEGARRVRELIGDGWHVIATAKDMCCVGSKPRIAVPAWCMLGRCHRKGLGTRRLRHGAGESNITVLEHAFLNDVLVRDGHVAGVRLAVRDAQDGVETRVVDTDRVVLATGGAGRLFPYTTNPAVATGDGLAAAIRAGAQVADLEFYQFHPTALAIGEHFLVSEAVRGEGAVLLDEHGHRFMADIDPRRNSHRATWWREPTSVPCRRKAASRSCSTFHPWAKRTPIGGILRHRFPTIDAYTRSLGFDWSKEPIPVAPAAHYWMGGIRTDLFGRASIPGLYAAGECARTGVQGANRLASNSLLEGMVYGYRAGLAAANDTDGTVWQPQDFGNSAIENMPVCQQPMLLHMPDAATQPNVAQSLVWDRARIEDVMWQHVGVIRDGDSLSQGVRELGEALSMANAADSADMSKTIAQPTTYAERIIMWENRNLLTVGYVAAVAASNRCESRGAHTRQDYLTNNPTIAHSIAYQMS